ncbi:MAG: MgtC/SapB family protein [Anaerolinea sp.]|nr:MgtC/SapB family protein [Anaerolinea sp.]
MSIEQQLIISVELLLAAILSGLIGYDRERNGRGAGLRTHILVGVGSALFTGLSMYAFGSGDRGRVAAQIVTGIGFLGAGAILRASDWKKVRGLTTAAGIWAVSAIGMACGSGNVVLAINATIIAWVTLAVLKRFERRLQPKVTVPARPTKPPKEEENSRSRGLLVDRS